MFLCLCLWCLCCCVVCGFCLICLFDAFWGLDFGFTFGYLGLGILTFW